MSGDHNMYCSANNPKDEWIELPTLVSVCNAQTDGWEIEMHVIDDIWGQWDGTYWECESKFRGRPRKPVMRKVKMLCFTDGSFLFWRKESRYVDKSWIRVPAEDKTIEIPESV